MSAAATVMCPCCRRQVSWIRHGYGGYGVCIPDFFALQEADCDLYGPEFEIGPARKEVMTWLR